MNATWSTLMADPRHAFELWLAVRDAEADAIRRIAENRPYEDAITIDEFRAKYLPGSA